MKIQRKLTVQTPPYLQLHVVAESTHDLHDLLRQLAGGRKHEGLTLVQGRVNLLKDRNRERRGLTGTFLE